MDVIFDNLDWLVYGLLIGLFVPTILLVGNKIFGLSSSLIHICSIVLPKNKTKILGYDLKEHKWKFYFVIGIVLGAVISTQFLSQENAQFLPDDYYSLAGLIKLFIGGILVGFGTRYANGCTSGHSISGLSMLQKSSLFATIAFFVGGLIFTFFNYYVFN